ncbi:MAG TPA: hypothetical protein VMB80_14275 [Candidatus Acidoferrum sp.]|nr:hypothetical protein [Candidatus Acidoferrum sp.]
MKTIAIFAADPPGESAEAKGLARTDEHPPGNPPSESALPAPAGAAIAKEGSPAGIHSSVVSKVAKLLITRGPDIRWDHPIRPEGGFVHDKILMSLQAKQSCT